MTPPVPPEADRERLRVLLDTSESDDDIAAAVEGIAVRGGLADLCCTLGPSLYRRDPLRFRPALMAGVHAWCRQPDERAAAPWRNAEGAALVSWLEDADRQDDVDMFRVLWGWRARTLPLAERVSRWREELVRRFDRAGADVPRALVLSKMQLGFPLDERSALVLYRASPDVASRFIQRHIPADSGDASAYWAELSSLARARGDHDLFFTIYRKTVEADQWARDVGLLVDRIEDAAALVEELMRRHPLVGRRNLGSVLLLLIRKRGRDVMPYVLSAVRRSGTGFDTEPARLTELVGLADERGWLELWSALLASPRRAADLEREVRRLADDARRSDQDLLMRLDMIARASVERRARAGTRKHPTLSDDTAVRLHARYPWLVREELGAWLSLGPGGYLRLLDAAMDAKNEALVDRLAGLVLTTDMGAEWARRDVSPMATRICRHFEAFSHDPDIVCSRVARVLGCVSPGTTYTDLAPLTALNPLAHRIWNEWMPVYASCPALAWALLQCPSMLARHLGFRIVADPDCSFRQAGVDQRWRWMPVALEPMPGRVRRAAIRALRCVVQDPRAAADLVVALRVVCEARVPGPGRRDYLALLGTVLSDHPDLRRFSERDTFLRSAHEGRP